MYLHLGNDVVVRTRDVVGIFDIENASIGKSTKDFLAAAQKSGRVVNVTLELPKSFILCQHEKKSTLYISQISSSTLKKRSGFMDDLSNV